MKARILLTALAVCLTGTAFAESSPSPGMVFIPGGTFAMGSALPGSAPDEQPVVEMRIAGFWMDATDVTNSQFRKFVKATGYKTIAERPIDWEELKNTVPPGTPRPTDEQLQPGAVTFSDPFARFYPSRFYRLAPASARLACRAGRCSTATGRS